MYKILLIVAFFTFSGLQGYSQKGDDGNGGRIEALKIAFLTRKLDLSTSEAQKFWPVYNNYTAEIHEVQRQKGISELEAEEKTLAIRKKYSTEFSKVLSTEKVNTLFRAEKEFRGVVEKLLNERRKERRGQ